MSIEQMSIVWKYKFKPAEQQVMLALADHAHDDGTEIRPSVARLAWKTGYSERQVHRVLKHLRDESKVLVLTRKGGGRGSPNVYRFDWTKAVKKSEFKLKKTLTSGDENTDTVMSYEPSTENRHESSESSNESSEAETEAKPPPSAATEEEKPVSGSPMGEMSTPKRQNRYVAYLHERLKERELLDERPLTSAYKKRLSGELREHINAGMRHARILLALDKIVFRWPEKRLNFYEAFDDGDELARRRKRRAEEPDSHLPKMRELQ